MFNFGWGQVDSTKNKNHTIQSKHLIVKMKEASSFFGGQHSLRINKMLEDNRCPEDVDCVWGGSAKIEFELIILKTHKHIFTLEFLTDGSSDTIIDYLQIQLKDLTPELRQNKTPNDKDYRVVAFISEIDTIATKKNIELLETKLKELPNFFFSATGINRFKITTKRDKFQAGCIVDERKKEILLNSIKLINKGKIQIVSLSWGGKRIITKLFYLDMQNKKILQVKEVY